MKHTERIGELFAIYQFALGAIAYCLTVMRDILDELGNQEAVELAEMAIRKCERARQLEYDWEQQKQNDPLTRPEAKALDDKIDSTLSRLMQVAEAFADSNRETRESRLAGEMLDDLFPSGVYPITSKPFDEQNYAVDELLERLNGEFSEHVRAVGMESLVEELDDLNEQFSEELNTTGEAVAYKEVEAARADAEDAFHRLIAKVMYDYGDDMETFNRVMEPVHEQTERTRRSLKRSGRIPTIDPESGEPVDEAPEDGQPDGGSPEDSSDDDSTETPSGDGSPDDSPDGDSSDGSNSEETDETNG
jgi:hypothetical protein